MATRNEHARALFHRAGGASAVAVAIDTRPKAVRQRKGKGSYRRRTKHRADVGG